MRRFPVFFLAFLLLGPRGAAAFGEDPFTWAVAVEPAVVTPGQEAVLKASLTSAPKHFIYADMTGVALAEDAPVTGGTVVAPKGKLKPDPFGDEPREVFTGTVTYTIPITVPAESKPGTRSVQVSVWHQGCSETVCYFPTKKTLDVHLQVRKGGAAASGPSASGAAASGAAASGTAGSGTAASGPSATGLYDNVLGRGWLMAFIAVFLGGMATSLTPCVYPLIPVTVSIFGATAKASRWRAFGLSITYVLGIAAMYSGMGLVAAGTGQVFGEAVASPVFVTIVAVVFGAFGLSMLGVFEIRLPTAWQTALTGMGKAGAAGAFVMGLVAGIIAAPCTGPVLGVVLTYVASTRNMVMGFWLLFTFALGMGVLFVLLGTFAGLAGRLPRSGPWMDGVKAALAIVMFAMVLFFLKEVIPGLRVVLSRSPGAVLVGVALLVGGYKLGALRGVVHGAGPPVVARKVAAVAACAFGAYMIIGGRMLPPVVAGVDLAWRHDLDAALADARAAGKPVMIDFDANWCVECKVIQAYTFADPQVVPRLKEFVLVQVDLSDAEATMDIRERYEIPGLPYVMFVSPDGTLRRDLTLTGFEDVARFLPRLDRVYAAQPADAEPITPARTALSQSSEPPAE